MDKRFDKLSFSIRPTYTRTAKDNLNYTNSNIVERTNNSFATKAQWR